MTTFVPRSAAASKGAVTTGSILKRALSVALPAALLFAAGADAQTFSPRVTAESGTSRTSKGSVASRIAERPNPLHNGPSYSAAEVQYRLLDSLLNAFSYYSGGQEPLQWDPASNTLVTIKRGPEGQSDLLYLRISTDMGQTWSAPQGPLNVATNGLARYPSIKIINKDNSSDRNDLLYYFTYPVTVGDAFGTFYQGFLDANFQPLSPPEANTGVTIGGELNGWSSDSRSAVSTDGNFVLTAGGMANNNIGLRKFDLVSGLLTAMVPPQWTADHYVDPGDPDSRTSVLVGMDRDANNTFYTAIYSRFPDQEVSRRIQPYPAVSMSNDNGATWSDWDILPISVLEQYALSQGANPDSVILPYNQAQDFIVTGNGNFSFVSNLFETNADLIDRDPVQQIVEIYRNNGTWGIRKVADISGSIFLYDPVEPGDERQNQLANEAQISRTADGSGLIVKWVDLVNYMYEEDINGDDEGPDTLTTSDVFVAVRKLASNDWSRSDNVTETPMLDRISWIPNMVPNNYDNIPLLTVQGQPSEDDVTLQDQLVTGQLDVANRLQYVYITNFNASELAGVSQGAVTARSGMTLNPAFPNPATSDASISFQLPQSGEATLEVWNVVGERVATLSNGTVEAGEHTAKLNVAGLPAGTYYYTLKSGGETLTRMFTVVR